MTTVRPATQPDVKRWVVKARVCEGLSPNEVNRMAARIDDLVTALRDIMYHTRGEHPMAHRIAYLAVGAYTSGGDV